MDNKKLYIGSLPYSTTAQELHAFVVEKTGTEVPEEDIMVITDRFTGQSKGFGFAEFKQVETPEELQALADKLNGQELGGRTLVVNIAKERTERPAGGGNRYNDHGGNGGGGRFGNNNSHYSR